ncbi:MAG: D-alanyl-D-alanine carboxypeptidase, partial [Alphaproteobacteria bacterium]|nr:D-alanyl-D-alanine carboxypeptidase [Alphaproteobacteria bacterium]
MKFYKILSLFAVVGLITEAHAIETKARNAILMDYDTGEYLYTKDAFVPVPPASMSKLMTTYILFSKIKDGSLSLEDVFTVSENAWKKGGAASGSSTMFLPVGDKVKVEDLIRGILIQSGNDACITVAENIAGSEEDFAVLMNEKAAELGLKNSHFDNATGLPSPDHKMSAEDLAKLAKVLIRDFPEFYSIFSEKSFTYHNIVQGNRNPLLYSMPDADGLKTGHTEEAGYGLTASAKRGNRRLIGVMNGMSSNKERSEEAEKLMSWGFREFDNYKVFKQFQRVVEAPVYMGTQDKIDLVTKDDVVVTLPRSKAKEAK